MRGARPVEVNSVLRNAVERLARGRSMPARVVERARIVLRAADGLRDKQIAQELGMTAEKAARWRNPFLDGGIAALQKDAPRPGRTRTITEDQVKRVVETTWPQAGQCHALERCMFTQATLLPATLSSLPELGPKEIARLRKSLMGHIRKEVRCFEENRA
jgi:hypothetical protein